GAPARPAQSSRAPSQPVPAPVGRAAIRGPQLALPRTAPAPGACASTSADPAAPATSIPTELPDSPSLARKLSRDGVVPDYREVYTYQLGLMAFTEQCMRGRVAKGVIYYYIHWDIDEDHFGTSP